MSYTVTRTHAEPPYPDTRVRDRLVHEFGVGALLELDDLQCAVWKTRVLEELAERVGETRDER